MQYQILSCWKGLTDRKKDSNRYAARHVDIKLNALESYHGDMEEAIKKLAPIEHKRWCAEELVLDYRYAKFPEDKKLIDLLKNELKVHELIVPFKVVEKEHGKKDEDLFRLLPVLGRIRERLGRQ
jgi:hypothetical protein